MAVRVVVPPAVQADIEAAGAYIAEQGNLQAALELVDKLQAKCASLSLLPERGAPYRERYRRVFEGRYQIIYRLEDRETVVVVHHMSRAAPEGL